MARPGPSESRVTRRSARWRLDGARLDAAERFTRGRAFEVRLSHSDATPIRAATLHYRRVDQSETFRSTDMEERGTGFVGTVPAGYTDTTYPLVYFVEVHRDGAQPIIFPGFDDSLANQPYVVVRGAPSRG